MTLTQLEPKLELLTQEYVLVQAWKKASSYIRQHNWYADTLELDRAAVNLPAFLSELSEKLSSPDSWTNDALRIVPAPKTQRWHINGKTGHWEPVKAGDKAAKIRPLAHVSLRDQVATTAVMLCLADRIETLQGNPAEPIYDPDRRKNVVSYGNRLFCDVEGGRLHHRWGSSKLYRAYYVDYRTFIARPEVVAETASAEHPRVIIVHADLRQFYDRVHPQVLLEALNRLATESDDPRFYLLLRKLIGWQWDKRDLDDVGLYAKQAGLSDFTHIALPQGMVASGFFANVVLLSFDQQLRDFLSMEIAPGVQLLDSSRYVDDLRIVVAVSSESSLKELESTVAGWLQGLLSSHAPGLKLAEDKTLSAEFRGDERPLVRQSRKMARIQSAVSGGFDAIGGEEILDAVQGLMRSQQRYSSDRLDGQSWSLAPVPDVRDATVARFAAGRYRRTYRSLRPLMADLPSSKDTLPGSDDQGSTQLGVRSLRSQQELDDDAKAFALGLVENWVSDPSNVRLLRIGLDLWPSKDVLQSVLDLLRPFTQKGGRRKAPRRVAWYCLSEILRAGATETGMVEHDECLPAGVDIAAFRDLLTEEAVRILAEHQVKLPWYLRQQAFLFLAVINPSAAPVLLPGRNPETKHYRDLIRFIRQQSDEFTGIEFATLAILCRRSFADKEEALKLVSHRITVRRLEHIAERDPSFAIELIRLRPDLARDLQPRIRTDLGVALNPQAGDTISLSRVVLTRGTRDLLRNELSLLRFAATFLAALPRHGELDAIAPEDVVFRLKADASAQAEISEMKIIPSRVTSGVSLYRPPAWASQTEKWRFQLGYLLRFMLTANVDHTRHVRRQSWRESAKLYRVPESHWHQRIYGFYNGQSAFGDDWLPISDWMERFLSALLAWPGCRTSRFSEFVAAGIVAAQSLVTERIDALRKWQGPLGSVFNIPLSASWPVEPTSPRPLRVCITQTVIPSPSDFVVADLSLSAAGIRKRHRNHLATALAAVERMLDLRETHKAQEGRLDWLILPELAVHPKDVDTHLVPFARKHKTVILAGLVYQELFPGEPLVNSAIWVIPVLSKAHGLQIVTRRQGKQHLAPLEATFANSIQGFRPCQWLVGYEWSASDEDPPLWLTASVCYDATDIQLAAGLRGKSDVFAIPALNHDVATFDQMAQALHYHMYQMVIVANNGSFGGSNAYVPYHDAHFRQVFHLHGQPQASVAFLEIDDICKFLKRQDSGTTAKWKFPPAGL